MHPRQAQHTEDGQQTVADGLALASHGRTRKGYYSGHHEWVEPLQKLASYPPRTLRPLYEMLALVRSWTESNTTMLLMNKRTIEAHYNRYEITFVFDSNAQAPSATTAARRAIAEARLHGAIFGLDIVPMDMRTWFDRIHERANALEDALLTVGEQCHRRDKRGA